MAEPAERVSRLYAAKDAVTTAYYKLLALDTQRLAKLALNLIAEIDDELSGEGE
jgi:hypothetical protein